RLRRYCARTRRKEDETDEIGAGGKRRVECRQVLDSTDFDLDHARFDGMGARSCPLASGCVKPAPDQDCGGEILDRAADRLEERDLVGGLATLNLVAAKIE